ncbi:WD40 repeat-like protein [Suillus decipiens]|nr:WD40 repeat-like protein [Suillus decipiens]
MASSSTQPSAAEDKSILKPVMTLEGHEPWHVGLPDGKHHENKDVSSISYFPDGKQMVSGSRDKTIRRWDLREGKEIENAREVCENRIRIVGVSKNGQWVVTVGWHLKVSEVETGIVRTFHEDTWIECIDISADSTLLVGAASMIFSSWIDYAVRIWRLDTGELIAGPFKLWDDDCPSDIMLRLSEDSRKLAVISSNKRKTVDLQVWDVQTQKLDVQKSTPTDFRPITPLPVSWTTKHNSIVTTFGFGWPISEFGASTLKTVGAPFKGHTNIIRDLALSPDCILLASSSSDDTIKLWAFESRQLLASFDVKSPWNLVLSPDSRQLAYTTLIDTNIYICNIPANILTSIGLAEEPQPSTSKSEHPRDPHPLCRFLRKLLPSPCTDVVLTDEPHNPLDFPATSPLPRPLLNPDLNSRFAPAPPITQSSVISTSSTLLSRLYRPSTWWAFQTDHASPAIVDVALAPAKLRYATAGAPSDDDGLTRDEDYVPPPPSPNTGQYGSGR